MTGGTGMSRVEEAVFDLIEKEYICDLDDIWQQCRLRLEGDTYISKGKIKEARDKYKFMRFGQKGMMIIPERVKAFQLFDEGLSIRDAWIALPEVKQIGTVARYRDDWEEVNDMKNPWKDRRRKREAIHHFSSGVVFGPWTSRDQMWKTA